MENTDAIIISNISKTFKVSIEDHSKKSSIFNKTFFKVQEKVVLDNLSLVVKKGEVVAILGRNGSGKSTLLSIISRIMEPDTGSVEYNGKLSAILELSMGFHPDMSGKENIYLKGELYGLSKAEIDSKYEDIVNYSGIIDYIDNPVRTYSSGMIARLAFSILINIDSDILVVDEVLSVGDTIFAMKAKEQFKKLAAMGKTILIVSHNVSTLENLCTRAIWIENGHIIKDGPAKIVCAEYINKMSEDPEIIQDLANAGVSDSQYKLGMLYRNGENWEHDSELSERWIKAAALQGHIKAQLEYGDLLLNNNDIDSAREFYFSAAKKGNRDAKSRLARIQAPVDTNVSCLLEIFDNTVFPGNGLGEYRYGGLLLKTAWTNEDRVKAFNMFLKSAQDGYVESLHQVALMYRDGVGVPKNNEKMIEYLTKASDAGLTQSTILLADLYSQGNIVPKDDCKSFKYSLRAANMGDINSMFKVGLGYQEGIGVEVDLKESEKWFNKFNDADLYWHYIWASELYVDSPKFKID